METYIKQNIYFIMNQRGISTSKLSEKSHISERTLSDILNLKTIDYNPRLSTLYSIANSLDVKLLDLFVRSENMDWSQDTDLSQDEYLQILRGNFSKSINGKRHNAVSIYPDLSESTISKILSGYETNPKLLTIEAISRVTQMSISELFTRGG
ncbi:helix-turn-helix domain-containing protein [Enterococcus camelliae]|uniref:Helix-turn-helix domain-containing protein n=1 Tax=Enterococcus camelliae TaxID=453959 RepID=A0ABW5TI03_9ENTE